MRTDRRGFIGTLLATPLLARFGLAEKSIVPEGILPSPLSLPTPAGLPEVETFKGARGMYSWTYSASGLMKVPPPGSDGLATILGAPYGRISMTLPAPEKGSDGDCLTIVGSDADITTGTEAGADSLSFGRNKAAVKLIAVRRAWIALV